MWGRFSNRIVRTLPSGPSRIAATILIICRAHAGTNKFGLNFSETYSGWKTNIIDPFTAHLNRIFSAYTFFCMLISINSHPAPEMRQAVALPGTISTQDPSPSTISTQGPSPSAISTQGPSSNIAANELIRQLCPCINLLTYMQPNSQMPLWKI